MSDIIEASSGDLLMLTISSYHFMTFSDHVILEAIERLSDKTGVTDHLRYRDIIQEMTAPCSTRTMQRAIVRLEKAGKLKLHGAGYRKGYRYEVIDGDPN